jgi:hypothetical protein
MQDPWNCRSSRYPGGMEKGGPVVFQRKTRSKLTGCLVYAAMTGVLVVLALLVAGLAAAGLGHYVLGRNETAALAVFLVLGGLLAPGAVVLAVREYRRMSSERIAVFDDRLESGRADRPTSFLFDDLLHIGRPDAEILQIDFRGGTLKLARGEWPAPDIAQAIEDRAVEGLVARRWAALQAGAREHYGVRSRDIVRWTAFAAVQGGIVGLFVWLGIRHYREKGEFPRKGLALPLLFLGLLLFGVGRIIGALRGGFAVERDGLRGKSVFLPWGEILRVEEDTSGLAVVDRLHRRPLRLSRDAVGYHVARGMIAVALAAQARPEC